MLKRASVFDWQTPRAVNSERKISNSGNEHIVQSMFIVKK